MRAICTASLLLSLSVLLNDARATATIVQPLSGMGEAGDAIVHWDFHLE